MIPILKKPKSFFITFCRRIGTKSDKEMQVFVDELGDSAVVLGLRVWVPTEKYWNIKWRLNEK